MRRLLSTIAGWKLPGAELLSQFNSMDNYWNTRLVFEGDPIMTRSLGFSRLTGMTDVDRFARLIL